MKRSNQEKEKKRRRRKIRPADVILTGVVILLAVIFAVPLYIAVINIFKDTTIIARSPMSLPGIPTLNNLVRVFNSPNVNIGEMYFNSCCISLFGASICILVSSMASYYLTKMRGKMGRVLYVYFLFGLMVPYVIVYVPLVSIFSKLSIKGDLPSLIMVFVSGSISFSVFMFYAFIKSIPRELEEAAIIDGAGQFTLFFRIIMPLVKPCTTTVAIFIGLSMWNDFLTPLLIGQVKTITVGIYTAIGPYSTDWGLVFAYVFIASIPIATAYLFAQKEFISGLTAGALKG